MALFRFNDKKSQKQIGIALRHRSLTTAQQNANALADYYTKRARLLGCREEWELPEYQEVG